MNIPQGKRYGEETYKALRMYQSELPKWTELTENERNIWDSVAASTIESYFQQAGSAKAKVRHHVF